MATLCRPATSLAGTTGSLAFVILTDWGQPVAGAGVNIAGAGGERFSATTGSDGRVSFDAIPPDVYGATIQGGFYAPSTFSDFIVVADQSQSVTLEVHYAHAVVKAVRVALPPAAVESPAKPVAAAASPVVRGSLLATYNRTHPEHVSGQPYFGRYTYVLLGGGAGTDPRNRALVAALIAKYVPLDSTVTLGAPQSAQNPWGYNLFLLPVTGAGRPLTAGANTVDSLMTVYDYAAARTIRDRYCAVAAHAATTICAAPYDAGPIVLTFIRPLNALSANAPLPPAFAYDVSAVVQAQEPAVVDIIAKTITVPAPIQNDEVLPTNFLMKYVAPLLGEIADALNHVVPAMKFFSDNGLKASG
jgi:hypothetical protein